jgi:hypothetical protein
MGVPRQRVIRRAGAGIATWNRIFGGTISGARRACVDRDQRRIGENGGVHRQNSVRGQQRGSDVGRAREIGVYRCALAFRRALVCGLRLSVRPVDGSRPRTSRKHRLCSGRAALVAVVQTPDFWDLDDGADTGRVNGSRLRSVFAEREMSPRCRSARFSRMRSLRQRNADRRAPRRQKEMAATT